MKFYKHNPTHIYKSSYFIKLFAYISTFIFILAISFSLYKSLIFNTYSYYISTTGNDSNSGTKSDPLKSLNGFKDVLLSSINDNSISDNSNIKVYIADGIYYFDKSFSINNKDLANKNISINIIGKHRDNVIFTGGYSLNSKNFNNSILSKIHTYDLSTLPIPSTYDINNNKSNPSFPFCEVIFNNTPLTLARYPNDDFLTIDNIISSDKNNYNFSFLDSSPFKWKDKSNVYMSGYWYHNWSNSIVKATNLNKTNNSITIKDTLPYGIKENQRFYLFNSLDALDKKGEYYIDYEKKILYLIPPSSIKSKDIYINLLNEPIININECNNMTIKNITFQGGSDNLIIINKSININVDNCVLRNTSKNGIVFNNAKDSTLSNLHIYNTGEGGIIINGGNRETLESSNCTIYNNKINNFSRIKRTYTPAINISGVGIKVSKNTIFDSPHNGIMFSGNDHIIEKNEIYNICKETNDVGAIYTGRDWTYRGNIIRYNNIHDLGEYSPGNWVVGIYLDDCMSSANVYKNKITNVKLGILVGGGRDIIIEENQITNCENSIIFDERGLKGSNIPELEEKLKKVPYNNELWIKKYPEIKSLDKTDHGIPFNNTIKGNKLKNSGEIKLSENVIKYSN